MVDDTNSSSSNEIKDSSSFNQKWSIIAVNKFDSTRKRMSEKDADKIKVEEEENAVLKKK